MAVTKHSGLPNGRGEKDAHHYKNRVRRQIRDHLKGNVGKENIITGDGKIKVPVKGTKQYRFILDRGKGQGQGQGGAGTEPGTEDYEVWLDMSEVEDMLFSELDLPRLKPKKETDAETSQYRFNTIARKGPQVDKRTTLRRNIQRNAVMGEPKVGDFINDDIRYISYSEKPVPKSNAAVMAMMDVSGSMQDFEKQISRLFFYWIVQFLRHKYDRVEIVFIAHTTEAREVTEDQFFNRIESGGTAVSSAYLLAQKIQAERYPESEWNVYVIHASDGDNWAYDNEKTLDAVKELCKVCSLVAYLEIKEPRYNPYNMGYTTLYDTFSNWAAVAPEEFMMYRVQGDNQIWEAIKHFFAKEGVEGAVR